MPVIDQTRTWAAVEERLATETDPTLRRNLELLLAHSYHAYGAPPEASPQGKPAVRRFYEDFIASGATRLQFDVERIVVDRHCILTEGLMRMAYPGATLAARGIPVDDDGLIVGEDTYTGGNGFERIADRKLDPTDIV